MRRLKGLSLSLDESLRRDMHRVVEPFFTAQWMLQLSPCEALQVGNLALVAMLVHLLPDVLVEHGRLAVVLAKVLVPLVLRLVPWQLPLLLF